MALAKFGEQDIKDRIKSIDTGIELGIGINGKGSAVSLDDTGDDDVRRFESNLIVELVF